MRSTRFQVQPVINLHRSVSVPFRGFADLGPGEFIPRDDVIERVLIVVKNFEKVDPAKVNENCHFSKDLGLDSLDLVEVVMAMEEEFVVEIPDAEAEKILTTQDVINFIVAHPQAK